MPTPVPPLYSDDSQSTDTFTFQNAEEAAELKKKRTFRKFSYRGIDLDQYVQLPTTHVPAQPTSQSSIALQI